MLYNKIRNLSPKNTYMIATKRPVVLVVLDGWGLSRDHRNILMTTELPTITRLNQYYPLIALQASGISVGIPWGEAGNSEVGHMALGSGRIIYQNLPRISLAIQNGTFFDNTALIGAATHAKENAATLHIMGLLSSGAVHSHYDHFIATLELAKRNGCTNVALHLFLDGRDSAPNAGIDMITRIQNDIKNIGIGRIASIAGRHWAMDRNNNWDRIARAYAALTDTGAQHTPNKNLHNYITTSYANGTTDEFIEPTVLTDSNDKACGAIADGDSAIFINFREDRARQMTHALTDDDFKAFERTQLKNFFMTTMTQYDRNLTVHVAFPPQNITNTLGKVLSDYNKKQLRIAETEKYAHVTYFFNGGAEKPFPGEDRILIPSPHVMRFDEAPEMSAAKITDRIITELHNNTYDFILVNYANADMVGHTGNESAAREAVRSIDKTLSILIPAVLKKNGTILITADHGNVEELYNDKTGMISTEHSTNPVPLWYVTRDNHRHVPRDAHFIPKVAGLLSDVAPTVLAIMHLDKPREMHGQNLLPLLMTQK